MALHDSAWGCLLYSLQNKGSSHTEDEKQEQEHISLFLLCFVGTELKWDTTVLQVNGLRINSLPKSFFPPSKQEVQ